ncbi:MAG: phosphate acyltransferase PlsX [Coriobacteriia bacterium]|nr:phosphate acyltransferase PlsX [Coriobacteriia bacterium]
MSSGKVLIAVDALGADNAPSVVLDGVQQALELDKSLNILLCGPKDVVENFAGKQERCEAVVCSEEIAMDEHPANAVRKKKDSTIVVGCKCVKDGKADGFYSAGNTGACLAASTLVTGRIKGVLRPMLATNIPAQEPGKSTLFCDLGANADCKPENLLQFGIMASSYIKAVKGIKNPKVGLLNIGEEDSKGSQLAQEANALMKEKLKGFSGNAEGRDITNGMFDAVVTDGFTGNVVLKSMEGTLKMTFGLLKATFMSSLKSKIGALLVKGSIKKMVKDLDPESIGAALLFGVKGACCVGHGNSSAKAICNGILNTADFARNKVADKIEAEIKKAGIK